MGEAKIFLIPCETNILRPVIRIEVTNSGLNQCRVLGSKIFKAQIEHALARRVRPGKSERPKKLQFDP